MGALAGPGKGVRLVTNAGGAARLGGPLWRQGADYAVTRNLGYCFERTRENRWSGNGPGG
jgi:hypothetical protein